MAFDSGYALIIGVGTYAHIPQLNVDMVTMDAQELAKVLRDPSYCGYPADHVTLLTGAAATRDAILNGLDMLEARTAEQDTILLFYSGHGLYSDSGYHLAGNATGRRGLTSAHPRATAAKRTKTTSPA